MKTESGTENTEVARTWTMDGAHSAIEFSVKHMMISTVKGKFKSFSVKAEGSPGLPGQARVSVRIDPSSIETGEEKRDAHLRSPDFFSSGEFKEMTFDSDRVEKISAEEYILHGKLTIRGISKDISLNAEFSGIVNDPYGNLRFGVAVRGEITREEFGLKWNTILDTGGVMVGSKVKFEAQIEMYSPKSSQN